MFVLSFFDMLIAPFLLVLVYVVGNGISEKKRSQQPFYKWYTMGLMFKCMGAIAVCLIYQFYYGGGDTINYFHSASVIVNLLGKDPAAFFDLMLHGISWESYSAFDASTGYPFYTRDPQAMFVVRLIVPLVLISFKSFLGSAILLAWICYAGIWRIFLLFNSEFPMLQSKLAIAILFIPSVVFWGSGLLKDTITLSAVGWFTYYFYVVFIKRQYTTKFIFYILFAAYLLIAIKPYILFALIPGALMWISNQRLVKVKSTFMRFASAPFFISIAIGLSFVILMQMGSVLGVYSIDNILYKAVESNQDQQRTAYGGNSFNIGEIEATTESVLSKAHLAISATLFRPSLLDAKNPVMFMSAIENTYILFLTLFLLIRLKVFGFFILIGENPLLLFSIVFSLFFAFSVGIATSNFGTLVRLKIPCIPFFVSSLFVMKHMYDQKKVMLHRRR